jgi:hypothetical protein
MIKEKPQELAARSKLKLLYDPFVYGLGMCSFVRPKGWPWDVRACMAWVVRMAWGCV